MNYKGYDISDDGFTPSYYILASEFGPELGPFLSEEEAMSYIDRGGVEEWKKRNKESSWEWGGE